MEQSQGKNQPGNTDIINAVAFINTTHPRDGYGHKIAILDTLVCRNQFDDGLKNTVAILFNVSLCNAIDLQS